ncbi:hypothetical protein BDU57DRAFT_530492 [Ampelomyces quisqualis]|uniref:Store-operated calcium entry-associated regulatory factor n=1 Tax=Ampelomyces quisqualis TaxID=50730 RepID=A0A6A5QL18_AMPQU|nr:hypothetical protein BDU57DRAFT_530492 [Ampelomyces quisqualis]
MRCKNAGADYDENNIQWTCTASLPEEFKLGSTDVICEGYDFPDDPYILKGSCGVEYRLVLTDKGHEKYGKGRDGGWWGGDDGNGGSNGPKSFGEKLAAALFWLAFGGIALWIVYSAFVARAQGPDGAGMGGVNRPGWGGGGGGGWGAGDDPSDPPPPYYDSRRGTNKQGYGSTQQGWRPGFWSGALGGAAAGWAANRASNRGNQTGSSNRWGGGGGGWDNGGEGSSRSSSGSSSFSSTRHESTGFGSTSRR